MKCLMCGEPSVRDYCSKQCHTQSLPTMNEKCPDHDTEKCPACYKRFKCLDRNRNHRIKRADALDGINPGQSVTVDGIKYSLPKQGCINCENLEFRNKFFCTLKQIVISDIKTYDCEGKPGEGECVNCPRDKHKIKYYCTVNKNYETDLTKDRDDCGWVFGVPDYGEKKEGD